MKTNVDFSKAFVKSGSKTTSEASPLIMINSTLSNFKLNQKAMDLMDLKVGDTIGMIDGKKIEGLATDQNDRYYVCANPETGGAKIGETRAYNHATIYTTMMLNNFDIAECQKDDLIQAGLMVERETPSGAKLWIALKTGKGDLVPAFDGQVVNTGDGGERKVWMVTNLRFKDHDPKGGENEEEEVEVEEES